MENTLSQKGERASHPVALITGAAHRLGAEIARTLHREGYNIAVHFRHSRQSALTLQSELHALRDHSVTLIKADLLNIANIEDIVTHTLQTWGRLDVLINNASSFYPTHVGKITLTDWDDLVGTNLKAPLFLSQAAAPHLQQTRGCIVNIVDIHADRPLKNYPVYSIAKAGLVMLTKSLARELGPNVRVNAVAPGAILWPEHNMEDETKDYIVSRTALKRQGSSKDIARAALFLIRDAHYTSGHVLTIDGGRSLSN